MIPTRGYPKLIMPERKKTDDHSVLVRGSFLRPPWAVLATTCQCCSRFQTVGLPHLLPGPQLSLEPWIQQRAWGGI